MPIAREVSRCRLLASGDSNAFPLAALIGDGASSLRDWNEFSRMLSPRRLAREGDARIGRGGFRRRRFSGFGDRGGPFATPQDRDRALPCSMWRAARGDRPGSAASSGSRRRRSRR
jgi:hypothetical protein